MGRRLAVFASGSGTNFEAIAQACADGRLDAEVALMVCDRPGAAVVARAERFGIPAFVASPKSFGSKAGFEREVIRRLDALLLPAVPIPVGFARTSCRRFSTSGRITPAGAGFWIRMPSRPSASQTMWPR